MKKVLCMLMCCILLTGCGSTTVAEVTTVPTAGMEAPAQPVTQTALIDPEQFPPSAPEYVSRFDSETLILLSDAGITVNGGGETEAVYTSHDIIYYEDRDTYESGNPYGEGEDWEKHSAEEAAAHTVVNITAPGAYRLSGALSAGQIRVDLGEDAYDDPDAVVELILNGVDITCTVAPAILFLNTYECDGSWSVEDAVPNVDTSAAGANLILELENSITGSHVAKIYKDKDGEKKLWKQDGAIYSYMSMNIFGPASLGLTADNEGIDTELHLTINGGNITIFSDNDGINTNEDGVSVTTINGGRLWINAGLGAEGDGIDSNGYLVINGGIVSASANPAADAGLDSDLGSYINGGTVIALGSHMDWAESESGQVTMNLQFASSQQPGTNVVVTDESGTVVFAYTPDERDLQNRSFTGVILSSPNLKQGQTYQVYTGGTLEGYAGRGYLAQVSTVTGYTGGTQMQYTGSDVGMGGPGMGGRPGMGNMQPGEMPEDFRGERPEMPGSFDGQMPEDFDPSAFTPPEGETFPEGTMPEGGFGDRGMGGQRPEDFGGEDREGMEMPQMPEGEAGSFGSRDEQVPSAGTEFYMTDMVNAFSGLSPVSG